MDGQLSVQSEVGKGSTFTFTAILGLPDNDPEQDDPGKEPAAEKSSSVVAAIEEASGFEGFRVLVAEDNKVNQFVASKILRSVGATFKLVEDGVQAVKAFEEDDFYDIILMVGVVAVGVRDSCMLDLFWKLVVSNMPMHCSTWHVPL